MWSIKTKKQTKKNIRKNLSQTAGKQTRDAREMPTPEQDDVGEKYEDNVLQGCAIGIRTAEAVNPPSDQEEFQT